MGRKGNRDVFVPPSNVGANKAARSEIQNFRRQIGKSQETKERKVGSKITDSAKKRVDASNTLSDFVRLIAAIAVLLLCLYGGLKLLS
jgi:hypothetical protein